MGFSLIDFQESNTKMKLTSVIMDEMNYEPLRAFGSLTTYDKMKFNKKMNAYIFSKLLGVEDWSDVLTKDFNSVINSIFENPKFNPEKFSIPTNFEAEVMLSNKQKEFNENETKKVFV